MEGRIFILIIVTQIYQTISIGYKSPSLNYSYNLGINLVNNSNISSPAISPNYYADYQLEMNGWKTKGTYVEYALPCLMTNFYFCSVYKGVACGLQFLDVDSRNNNELYYQRFIFTSAQEYQLRFDWISQISFLLSSTGLSVYWNGVAIDSFYDNNCTLYTSTYYVLGKVGVNQVAFEGIGMMDSFGIMIRNIQLNQLIYSLPPSKNITTNSTANATNLTTANSSNHSNSSSNSNSSTISNTTNSTNSSVNINSTNLSNSTNTTNLTAVNGTYYSNSSNMTYSGNNSSNQINSSTNSSISSNSTNSSINAFNATNISNSNSSTTNNSTGNSTGNTTGNITDNSTDNSTNNSTSNSTDNSTNNSTINSTSNTTANSTDNSTSDNNSTMNNTTFDNNAINSTSEQANNTNIIVPNSANFSGYSYQSYENLYKFYNSSQYANLFKAYTFATKYKAVTFCRSLFSSQQNLRFIVGFMMEFNHLIIYNYHIRNITLMANFILVSIQALDEQKAFLTDQYIYPMIGTSPDEILYDFRNRIDLPTNPNNIASEWIKRPNGVLLQITDMFFVDIPVTIVTFMLGYVLFRLLFHFKISILFRHYSLMGLFFFILLNGKIQVITFHFLSEVLSFTSIGFRQKILMMAILFFYFFVFIISISIMMLYKSFYKKLVKYMYENCRQPLYAVPFMTVSFGFYNLTLGFAHRLLLNYPKWQIYVLLFIEIVYLIALIANLIKRFFENVFLGLSLCIMNLLRVFFIITCIIYSISTDLQEQLNQIQQYLFYSLLVSWLLSIALGLLQKIVFILKIIKNSIIKAINNKNRIKPINNIKQTRAKPSTTLKNPKNKKIEFQDKIVDVQTQEIKHFSITIKSLKGAQSNKKTVFTRIGGFTRTNIMPINTIVMPKTAVLLKSNKESQNKKHIGN